MRKPINLSFWLFPVRRLYRKAKQSIINLQGAIK
jgi:hypothetical protein